MSQELRDDALLMARAREKAVTIVQIARDSGAHEMSRHRWIRQAAFHDFT